MNVVFNLSSAGTWVLSNSLTPETSSYVVENIEYDATLSNVPDGKTVLPTDDIQTWLNCADIWDKEYTTLAEVLADKDTLVALMASDNAVDYMVRSTEWATQTTVPTMTSDTTPEGVCSASSTNAGLYPYYAFDKNDTTTWLVNGLNNPTSYIRYVFPTAVKLDYAKVKFKIEADAGYTMPAVTFKVQSSTDGNTFDADLGEILTSATTGAVVTETKEVTFPTSSGGAKGFQLYATDNVFPNSHTLIRVVDIQFYSASITTSSTTMQAIGASDYASDTLLADSTWRDAILSSDYWKNVINAEVPVMTSNTEPSGEASASSTESPRYPWKAFDGDSTTFWNTDGATSSAWIQYRWDTPCTVYAYKIKFRDLLQQDSFKLSVSSDGTSFTDITETVSVTQLQNDGVATKNTRTATICRLTSMGSASYGKYAEEIQFYGRQPGGVQTWLHKAGITDKNYTTLAEVLNDATTLSLLMANEDAVDYLVTCKEWATAQALIPTMTSNTTPSGTCVASSEDNPAYYAFNGNTSNGWSSATVGTSNLGYIGYKFTEPIDIKKVSLLHFNSANFTCKVQYSDDGVDWTDVENSTFTAVNNTQANVGFDAGSHLYWAVYYLSASTSTRASVNELQFYSASIADSEAAMQYIGQNNYAANTLLADEDWCNAICNSEYFESVLNVKVPTMTSATTPEGEVSAGGTYGSQVPYMAFDNNIGNAWRSQSLSTSDHTTWIQYKFTSVHKIYRVYWSASHSTTEGNLPNASIKIQASNDNSTFTDIYSEALGSILNKEFVFVFTCDTEYQYWRLWIDANVRSLQPSVYAIEAQFYGREDV